MAAFFSWSGTGGGAYAGGGGIDESGCGMDGGARLGGGGTEIPRSGMPGGARLGICGSVLFTVDTGLRVDVASRRWATCGEGASRSSGKRNEFIVVNARRNKKRVCVFGDLQAYRGVSESLCACPRRQVLLAAHVRRTTFHHTTPSVRGATITVSGQLVLHTLPKVYLESIRCDVHGVLFLGAREELKSDMQGCVGVGGLLTSDLHW